MYKRPLKGAALSIGVLLGNLEGVRLLGLLREKEYAYLCSFSWTKAPLSWYQIMGHRGPFIRPRCIETGRARTQMLILSNLTYSVS
jgi:hypothetical protein